MAKRLVVASAAAALLSQLPTPLGAAVRVPMLAISPPRALLDEPVDVRVTGFGPREKVTLIATARDAVGVAWRSELVLTANEAGVVDTHSNMKLFWSMRPARKSGAATFLSVSPGEMTVVVRARARGRGAASGVLVRRVRSADVIAEDTTAADEGFAGTYYSPRSGRPRPGVL